MNLSWLQSAMMGFVSGFCEPSPVSAEAHRALLLNLFGKEGLEPVFLLACHAAALAVLILSGQLELNRLSRARSLQRKPPRHRSAHPDRNSLGTLAILRPALILTVLGRLISVRMDALSHKLYILSAAMAVCGILLWLPAQMRSANKDGRHLSPAEGVLIGLGAALAALPGISLVGAAVSLALIAGADRRYALRFSWLLLTVSLAAALAMDALRIVLGGASFGLSVLLSAAIGAAGAAAGAFLAVKMMLALVRRGGIGVSGFSYYNWGLALFSLVLFLLV